MDDLVERLRRGDLHGDCKRDRCCCPIMEEAADEIERLRKSEQDLRYSFEKVLMDIKFIIEKNRVFDDHIYQSAFKLMTDEFMEEFNNG